MESLDMANIINCDTGQESVVAENISVEDRKVAMVETIKTIRDANIAGGVNVAGVGVFDSDDTARLNITGAVVMAQVAIAAGSPFSMSWKLANNSIVTLNATQMISVGIAAGTHVAACHARAQALGISVQGAADHTALDAIDLNAGWPT